MSSSRMKMMKMSEQEMMNLWKLRTGIMPLRQGCTIEREDGIDVEFLSFLDMREWYANLLKEAPIDWLPCREMKDELSLKVDTDNVGCISLPEGCIRPVRIKLASWQRGVEQFWEATTPVAMLQENNYSRGNAANPVIITESQALRLYVCSGAEERIENAMCIAYPKDGSYEFAELALSTIPKKI